MIDNTTLTSLIISDNSVSKSYANKRQVPTPLFDALKEAIDEDQALRVFPTRLETKYFSRNNICMLLRNALSQDPLIYWPDTRQMRFSALLMTAKGLRPVGNYAAFWRVSCVIDNNAWATFYAYQINGSERNGSERALRLRIIDANAHLWLLCQRNERLTFGEIGVVDRWRRSRRGLAEQSAHTEDGIEVARVMCEPWQVARVMCEPWHDLF